MGDGVRVGNTLRERLGRLAGAEGAAIVEFAVSLPLLIVLVVGIYDFGAAFNMRQQLNNAAREGARYGSTQSTNDLYTFSTAPPSVNAIQQVVDAYLLSENINDCGLSGATGNPGGAGPAWTYDANIKCPAPGLQLTINRGYAVVDTSNPGNPVNVLSTQVQLTYPYPWHFNNVIGLLVPGAHLSLLTIQTQATSVNTD